MEWDLDTIVMALMGLHLLASVITAATPTPKDDRVLAKIYRWIERAALVVGKAKQ
jgi:hypothetical protein